MCHSVPMGTPLIYIQLNRAPANLHSGIPNPRTPGSPGSSWLLLPLRHRLACAPSARAHWVRPHPRPTRAAGRAGTSGRWGRGRPGRGGPCGEPRVLRGTEAREARGARAEPVRAPPCPWPSAALRTTRPPTGWTKVSLTTAASWTRSTWCHMSSCSSSPSPSSSSVSARAATEGGRTRGGRTSGRGGGGARPRRSRTTGSPVFLGPLLCVSSLTPSPILELAPDRMGASDLRDPQVLLPQNLTRDGARHARESASP